jgi:competence protein ComEC
VTLRLDPRHCLVAALCVGLAGANAARLASPLVVVAAVAAGAAELGVGSRARGVGVLAALALLGWWWGSVRLDAIDRSPLLARVGTAERALLEVTAPPRPGPFDVRVSVKVRRFGWLRPHEPALLRLPRGRAPPQGSLLEAVVVVKLPRGPQNGFDERTYLRRHGVHVVLAADRFRVVGRRGGLGGLADRLRARLARSAGGRLTGERRGLIEGVVLGDDQGLSPSLRDDFRASGLYHLLAVSGQNIVLIVLGVLAVCWLAGIPRLVGELGALAAIAAYVLAVGPQPSVIRAGVSGALGSLAWIAARERDRWHFLLLGALVLLAWNPYTLLDAGFELSFVAVAAIFVLVPTLQRRLEGYPVPDGLRGPIAVSTACGLATAPVLWLQFHAIPLLSIPANAAAAPAMGPLLYLAFASAVIAPVSGGAAATLAWVNGWCAAYLAGCARVVAGLPFAQVRSSDGLLCLLAVGGAAAAYALGHERPQARLPARGHRPAEDHAGAPAAAEPGGRGRGRAPRRGRDER